MKKHLNLSVILCFLISVLYADQIDLNNGNTVTGSIILMDEETVKIQTDNGLLELERDRVIEGRFGTGATSPLNGILMELLFNGNSNDSSGDITQISNTGAVFSVNEEPSGRTVLETDGSGQFLMIESTDKLSELDVFTLSFWIFFKTGTETRYFISKWDTTEGMKAEGKFAICSRNSSIYYYIVDSTGYYHTLKIDNALTSEEWIHITAVCGLGTMSLYINGELKSSQGFNSNGLLFNESPIYIMTAEAVNDEKWSYYNVDGFMDDLQLYSRELTANEILNLYRKY